MKSYPHDIQAEQAVLCAIINAPFCRAKVKAELSPDDFYREVHSDLFSVICSNTLDLTGIHAELQSQALLEKCGGKEYLMELATMGTGSAHWAHYVRIVEDLAVRRRIIEQCQVTAEKTHDTLTDISAILSEHKTVIRGLDTKECDYQPNKELVNRAYEIIGERHRTKDHRVGILTGYKNIDSRIHGMEPKTTFYLKGESGTGKSALALNIGENLVSENDGSIPYFTLESTALALTFRRFARHSRIALTRIRTGNIKSDAEWEDITRTCNELYNNGMILLEHSRFRWFENIQTFCESYAMSHKLLLVIIDFLQLMRTRVRQNSRHLELSYISDSLNYLAKDLNCPILILSQVNKDYQTKESRDIENNADNIWEIKRETKESELATIRATKGKDSGTWQTTLRFDRFIQRFCDCDEQYEAPLGD